jgi:hypothetical protein
VPIAEAEAPAFLLPAPGAKIIAPDQRSTAVVLAFQVLQRLLCFGQHGRAWTIRTLDTVLNDVFEGFSVGDH